MSAYYNEHDADKAAWLRELIKAELIAPGDVDERDIQDVLPGELVGYTQCHFFAGIAVWSYALRRAGWPDDRPVWTGSCPCQPFSAAGKRAGTSDERHLWPAFYHLISVNRPDVVFGEQVASKDGFAWLDTVQADLEAAAYAVGALSLPACGFGAPHRRERLFFVGDATQIGRVSGSHCERAGHENEQEMHHELRGESVRSSATVELADTLRTGRTERRAESGHEQITGGGESRVVGDSHDARSQGRGLLGTDRNGRGGSECAAGAPGVAGGLAYANGGNPCAEGIQRSRQQRQFAQDGGAVKGFWRDAEWLYCRDGKYRPTQPGSFPLAHGVAARILRLRGYGDGIVAPVAEEFIRAYMTERSSNDNRKTSRRHRAPDGVRKLE